MLDPVSAGSRWRWIPLDPAGSHDSQAMKESYTEARTESETHNAVAKWRKKVQSKEAAREEKVGSGILHWD